MAVNSSTNILNLSLKYYFKLFQQIFFLIVMTDFVFQFKNFSFCMMAIFDDNEKN